VIGVPLDLGQSRRGVDMGPSAVRVAGLEARLEAIGHTVEDAGNVAVAIPEQKKEGAANAKYLKEITATCTKSAELVLKTLEAGKVPLVSAAIILWPPARYRASPSTTAARTRRSD
jgi:arginase